MGPSDAIEHGVPKAVAEQMVEQIMQEFEAGCKSLTEELILAKIESKVDVWKYHAATVVPLLILCCRGGSHLLC